MKRRGKGTQTQRAPRGELGASRVRDRREESAGTSSPRAGNGTGSGFSQAVAPVGAAPWPLAGVEVPRHRVRPAGPRLLLVILQGEVGRMPRLCCVRQDSSGDAHRPAGLGRGKR